MDSIGQIIAKKRKKCGLSQDDLAKALHDNGHNLTRKAISKWEQNATEPGLAVFMSLCRILGIHDIYETFLGSNPFNPMSTLNDEGKAKVLDYISLIHDTGKYEKNVCKIIPFRRDFTIYENAVSAGTGNFLEDGPSKIISIDTSLVPENASFGVKISGNSMEPKFSDGQVAIVMKQETVENGEIGIFSLNGDAYIKKLKEDGNGIFLISLNNKYKPIPVGKNDRLDVFGKVIGKLTSDEISETALD